MDGRKRRGLEDALRERYALERSADTRQAQLDGLIATMLAEDERFAQQSRAQAEGSMLDFVASQVCYIPVWVWATQLALVGMLMLVAAQGLAGMLVIYLVGMLSAMSVLVGVPVLQASRAHQMAELEYACRNNAASVTVARMIVLGCASVLASLLMVAGAARGSGLGALSVALWTCPPYFCSCAGALLLLRRLRPTGALPACVAWVLGCCGALLALGHAVPDLYTSTSLATWALAAAVALAWLVREAVLTIRAATGGLDVFCPAPMG